MDQVELSVHHGHMNVRAARPADAHDIAQVHVRSWQDAYRGLLPQDFLDDLAVEDRRDMWSRVLTSTNEPRQRTFVATTSNEVVGFAHVGPATDVYADVGELRAIYVVAPAWGTGCGRALMAASAQAMRDVGFAEALLWVLAGNRRARRFYEVAGWACDDAERVDERWGFPLREVRYRLPLGAPSA